MFTFSTLMGSQLHFMALQCVAQQYELNFYGLVFGDEGKKKKMSERRRERDHKEEVEWFFAALTTPLL